MCRSSPRLAVWGTAGRQAPFAFGTPDQIRGEVCLRIEVLAPPVSSFALRDIDEPDVPWADVAAFLQAGAAFG